MRHGDPSNTRRQGNEQNETASTDTLADARNRRYRFSQRAEDAQTSYAGKSFTVSPRIQHPPDLGAVMLPLASAMRPHVLSQVSTR